MAQRTRKRLDVVGIFAAEDKIIDACQNGQCYRPSAEQKEV
jgi:hypothetical protein